MNINLISVNDVQILELDGDIDSASAPATQQKTLALIQPQCKILLDMSGVGFMSSAGLRMLLYIYRQIRSNGGAVALVGLSEDLQETMSMTGFLDFFQLYPTRQAGLAALEA